MSGVVFHLCKIFYFIYLFVYGYYIYYYYILKKPGCDNYILFEFEMKTLNIRRVREILLILNTVTVALERFWEWGGKTGRGGGGQKYVEARCPRHITKLSVLSVQTVYIYIYIRRHITVNKMC